jgi:RNA polymerase sigma-70 factor (ECF subfamily)
VGRRSNKEKVSLVPDWDTLEHFLAREWTKAHAQKTPAAARPHSLDETDAENRYILEPAHELTAEKIFDRRWATTCARAKRCRDCAEEYVANHKGNLICKSKAFYPGEKGEASYGRTCSGIGR